MNCPKCNIKLTNKDNCESCGENIVWFRKVVAYSNAYYNQGLEKVKLRDLSGAIVCFKKSIKFYKKNIEARNLLGLIYYEIGEIVSALSEWVVSVNYKSENNDASKYIREIQDNPTRLESINQTIKRYNLALIQAKQDGQDLAIIQLKKVLSNNPGFLRATHLLALLYMQNKEPDKARKLLSKALRIDVNNTTTLRYLKEINGQAELIREEKASSRREPVRSVQGADNQIIPVTTYKEEKPNIMVFVNLIIGLVIGIIVVYFLIVPNKLKNIETDNTSVKLKLSEELASRNATIAALESTVESLQIKIDSLESNSSNKKTDKNNDTKKETPSVIDYSKFFIAINDYMNGDTVKAAEGLVEVDKSSLGYEDAIAIYDVIASLTFTDLSKEVYDSGHADYTNGKYEEGKVKFIKALEYDETNVSALYFLGRSYHRLSEYDEAKECYDKVIDKFPTSSRASEAKSRLRELPKN